MTRARHRPPPLRPRAAFTLLEVLVSLAIVGMVMLALNTVVFSLGELWGKNTDVRLFEQHARAVTRFLDHELRAATLPPSAVSGSSPLALVEIHPQFAPTEKLLTFELPAGSRLLKWPDRRLPEVVCSLQVRPNDGLMLLWHSRLEKTFDTDPPRETTISTMVTAMSYDYYDSDASRWTTETAFKTDPSSGNPILPQRIRLKFTYGKLTRETMIVLPTTGQGLPLF